MSNFNRQYMQMSSDLFWFSEEKNMNYTLELSQKSYFQFSTIKPDNIGYQTIKIGQIRPLG